MKKTKNKKLNKDLIIYQAKSGAIEFRGDFDHGTIWATQKQISEVFSTERSVITKHINKIFKDEEVSEKSNVQKMHIANSDKPVKLYNLDIVLAVGYRTNSAKAIDFRKWATKILRQHLTRGYTINRKVISNNYESFLKSVAEVEKLLPAGINVPVKDILELIKAFSGTWLSLQSYDEDKFPKKGFTKKDVKIQSSDLYKDIETFKSNLIKQKQATVLFAQEKNNGNLEGIIGNVFQSVFGKNVYDSVEEKAAHLLYFLVKNHPFNDGNKRTGAFSFVWFLNKAGFKYHEKITPEALTVITLLVAESRPKEKDRIIGLILLLLKRK